MVHDFCGALTPLDTGYVTSLHKEKWSGYTYLEGTATRTACAKHEIILTVLDLCMT